MVSWAGSMLLEDLRVRPQMGRLQAVAQHPKARAVTNAWRIAQGSQSAIFKKIGRGGTSSAGQLRGQLDYVLSKADRVFCNGVEFDMGGDAMSLEQRDTVVEDWTAGWSHKANRGYTSHLMLSFPSDVSPGKAFDIAAEWAAEMFESRTYQDDIWTYVAALHTDRAHPHVHLVVNNRGVLNDSWFYMAKDHVFEANAMRERMVQIAEAHGVYMDSASRLDRGIMTYGVSRAELEAADRGSRVAVERKLHGPALVDARAHINETKRMVRLLSSIARAAGDADTSDTMETAAKVLEAGGILHPVKGKSMGVQDIKSQGELAAYFETWAQMAEAEIQRLPVAEQARTGAEFRRAASEVAMSLGDERGAELLHLGPVSEIYSTRIGPDTVSKVGRKGVEEFEVTREASQTLMADLKHAAGEVGIDAAVLSGRLRFGAASGFQEREWVKQDMAAVAALQEFELDTRDHRDAASEIADGFYRAAGELVRQARADVSEYDNARLVADLQTIGAMYSRHGAVEFASSGDVERFETHLEERYGRELMSEIAAGNDSALAADIPDAEERLEAVKGLLEVARAYGVGRVSAAQADRALARIAAQETAMRDATHEDQQDYGDDDDFGL